MSDDGNWGYCKSCKMWQIEPDAKPHANTLGVCVAKQLTEYRLRVSGNSGCTIYEEGEVQRQEGSAEAPPDPCVFD